MFEKFPRHSSNSEIVDPKVEEYRRLEAEAPKQARAIIEREIDPELKGHERFLAIINKAQEIADRNNQAERLIPEVLIRFASFEKQALDEAALREKYPKEAELYPTLQ